MKKEYILFIDSGFGGLSTLAETYKILPRNFIYFADTKNAPYGNHTKKEIANFLETAISSISKKFNVKTVVLACNTATTSSVKFLRKTFPCITIIGTEPAIALASKYGYKSILCLSTPATAKQKSFETLKDKLTSSGAKVTAHTLKDFASTIDEYFFAESISSRFHLQKNLYKIKSLSKNCDSVVLGCTHYCLLASDIFRMTNLPIFDGNGGVARRVFDVCTKSEPVFNQKPSVKFIFSQNLPNLKQKYIKIFKQILAKT